MVSDWIIEFQFDALYAIIRKTLFKTSAYQKRAFKEYKHTNLCSRHNGDPIVLHQWTQKPSTRTPLSSVHRLINDLFICCPNYSTRMICSLWSNSSCSYISQDFPRIGILVIRIFDSHDFAMRIFHITRSKVERLTSPFFLDSSVAWSCRLVLVLYFANDYCFEPRIWSFICSWSTDRQWRDYNDTEHKSYQYNSSRHAMHDEDHSSQSWNKRTSFWLPRPHRWRVNHII